MPGFFKKLFGASSPQKSTKRPPAKTSNVGKADRATLVAQAMKIYRQQRAQGRGVLEKAMADFRTKPPSPLTDREGLNRLLALRRAQLDLGGLFAHDLKRFLVLVGIRQWMGEGRVSVRPMPPRSKSRH